MIESDESIVIAHQNIRQSGRGINQFLILKVTFSLHTKLLQDVHIIYLADCGVLSLGSGIIMCEKSRERGSNSTFLRLRTQCRHRSESQNTQDTAEPERNFDLKTCGFGEYFIDHVMKVINPVHPTL